MLLLFNGFLMHTLMDVDRPLLYRNDWSSSLFISHIVHFVNGLNRPRVGIQDIFSVAYIFGCLHRLKLCVSDLILYLLFKVPSHAYNRRPLVAYIGLLCKCD